MPLQSPYLSFHYLFLWKKNDNLSYAFRSPNIVVTTWCSEENVIAQENSEIDICQ